MSPKPFSEVVDENAQAKEAVTKPFIEAAVGGKVTDAPEESQKKSEKQENSMRRIVNFLGSAAGFFSVLSLFLAVAIVADAIATFNTLLQSKSVMDTAYLIALSALAATLGIITYRNYKQIKRLESAKKMQELFSAQKKSPDKKILKPTLHLLSSYASRNNAKLKAKAELLQSRISSSHDYKEIYKDLDEEVLNVIDEEVQEAIKTASLQAALSTAISPLALLDTLIVVWRSFLLTKQIALLYGFRPGWLSTIVLLKQGAFNLFFAGAAELALEYAREGAESSLISKISASAGQGVFNGILLARLGYGVMQACRPLPVRMKRDSFVKGIYLSIKERIFKAQEKKV